jgi:hypothetical protein
MRSGASPFFVSPSHFSSADGSVTAKPILVVVYEPANRYNLSLFSDGPST